MADGDMVVDAGVSPEIAERVARMQKDAPPPAAPKDAPPPAAAKDAPPPAAAKDAPPPAAQGDQSFDMSKLDEVKIKMSVKGKEKEVSVHDLRSAYGRQEAIQKKYSEILDSEEYKMSLALKAAKGGDKAAQKAILAMIKESSGAKDVRDLERLDDVKEEFDGKSAHAQVKAQVEEDEYFADVKESVDFKTNIAKIDTELKGRIPDKVLEAFVSSPAHKRALYDLVTSGRADELIGTMDDHLLSLPLEKQLEIEGDPDLWGRAFIAVVRRANAKKGAKPEEKGDSEEAAAVSTGTRGRSADAKGSGKDVHAMSRAEFFEFRRKHGIYQ